MHSYVRYRELILSCAIQERQMARSHKRDSAPLYCPRSEERVSLLHAPSRQTQHIV